jgi:hypothetical protein
VLCIYFTAALESAATLNLKIFVHNDVDHCTGESTDDFIKRKSLRMWAGHDYGGYDECPSGDLHWFCRRNNCKVHLSWKQVGALRIDPNDAAWDRRSVFATYLGQAVGWYGADEGAGFIGVIVGAIIVFFVNA